MGVGMGGKWEMVDGDGGRRWRGLSYHIVADRRIVAVVHRTGRPAAAIGHSHAGTRRAAVRRMRLAAGSPAGRRKALEEPRSLGVVADTRRTRMVVGCKGPVEAGRRMVRRRSRLAAVAAGSSRIGCSSRLGCKGRSRTWWIVTCGKWMEVWVGVVAGSVGKGGY